VWFSQTPPGADPIEWPGSEADWEQLYWEHHWHCQYNSYPDRTGDLCSITKITDFYSARQWHSTGMYCDILPVFCMNATCSGAVAVMVYRS
jgi:hypothetical protein